MADNYDGEIKIKVTVDEKPFNDSMKDIGKSSKDALSEIGQESGVIGDTFKSKFAGKASAALGKLGTIGAAAFKGIAMALGTVLVAVGMVVAVIGVLGFILLAVGLALARLVISAVQFGIRMVNSMAAAMSKTDAYGRQVHTLKNAFDNVKQAIFTAFAPLVQMVLPYVQMITDWIIKAINALAMLLAFALGQSKVMQYTAGATNDMAGGASDYADEMERANEAAEGALGAFDQINVLQQEQAADNVPTGGGGGGQLGSFKEVDVDPEIWNKFKAKALEVWTFVKTWIDTHFFKPIRDWWHGLGETAKMIWWIIIAWFIIKIAELKTKWAEFKDSLVFIWEAIKQTAIQVWDAIVAWVTEKIELWKARFTALGLFLSTLWELIKSKAIEIWNNIVEKIKTKWEEIKTKAEDIKAALIEKWEETKAGAIEKWEEIKNNVATAFDTIRDKAQEIKDKMVEIWGTIKQWWTDNVSDPIKNKLSDAMDDIKKKWDTIWDGLKGKAKGIINSLIGFLNRLLSGFASAINGIIRLLNSVKISLPDKPWVPADLRGLSFGFNIPEVSAIQIPYLASGAVIPPNSKFLAVMGDQKHGTNIEAPADLIRQIVSEEMSAFANNQNINISFTGSMSSLVQVLKPRIDYENTRIGKSMIRGTV